jgi:hypothetical protein
VLQQPERAAVSAEREELTQKYQVNNELYLLFFFPLFSRCFFYTACLWLSVYVHVHVHVHVCMTAWHGQYECRNRLAAHQYYDVQGN